MCARNILSSEKCIGNNIFFKNIISESYKYFKYIQINPIYLHMLFIKICSVIFLNEICQHVLNTVNFCPACHYYLLTWIKFLIEVNI